MAGYIVVDVEVHDREAYEEYRSQVLPTIEQYGGRFLVRGGAVEVLEGDWQPGRFVILEFPSRERAREWYDSPEYQAILPIRLRHARSKAILVGGVPAAP